MAIPNNYIDKITDHDSGESRPICPPAEHVQVDNENFEGETLDEVLDEVAQAIEDAGQGGYAPPAGGIPKSDLAQSVQDSLDKADSALQDEDVAEVAKTGDYNDLEHKPTIPDISGLATKTELNAKQDAIVAGNGIVIANDGKTVSVDAEVVQPVTADGTFAVRIGNNTYSINLNHEHQGMAKLAKFVASNPPASMANDTIYAQVDNLATPTEIQSLWLFGCEFAGGIPDTGLPQVTKPINGSVIDLSPLSSSGASKVVSIKARNLTNNLTVTVGTGLTVTYNGTTASSVTIPKADAILGVDVTVAYTGTAELDDGALVIYHGNDMLASYTVTAAWVYNTNGLVFHLDGADATTSQWVDRKGGITFAMKNVTLDGNGGVVFNGTNSYGRYAAADSLGFTPATHTIEIVANVGGTATALLFMQNKDGALAVGLTPSNLIFITRNLADTFPQKKIENISRGFLTMSLGDSLAYINTVSKTVENLGCFDPTIGAGVFIGARDTTRSFLQGTIYQIRVYNRILTDAEILANQQIDINKYNIS